MAGRIKMQEEQVSAVASDFLNDAKIVQEVLNKFQSKYVQSLNENWEGDSKTKFMDEVQNNTVKLLQSCVDNLNNTGNSLKQIVEMFEQTDNDLSGKSTIQ
ncbi:MULTISPECIES: WXG100 family type VII secretion target [Clostridium]|uniref:WXG100 family type VII secretion target n=1 Tax=Clostridium TaxID=1485 RepID=UPI000826496C|nr:MULTISPECIES: WXG100 family type VII secretion target [Clostridium]PJI07947.1 WXG100 family type VII secretion target [Clostridium sp. CT7]